MMSWLNILGGLVIICSAANASLDCGVSNLGGTPEYLTLRNWADFTVNVIVSPTSAISDTDYANMTMGPSGLEPLALLPNHTFKLQLIRPYIPANRRATTIMLDTIFIVNGSDKSGFNVIVIPEPITYNQKYGYLEVNGYKNHDGECIDGVYVESNPQDLAGNGGSFGNTNCVSRTNLACNLSPCCTGLSCIDGICKNVIFQNRNGITNETVTTSMLTQTQNSNSTGLVAGILVAVVAVIGLVVLVVKSRKRKSTDDDIDFDAISANEGDYKRWARATTNGESEAGYQYDKFSESVCSDISSLHHQKKPLQRRSISGDATTYTGPSLASRENSIASTVELDEKYGGTRARLQSNQLSIPPPAYRPRSKITVAGLASDNSQSSARTSIAEEVEMP